MAHTDRIEAFYDAMTDDYHLIFADWESSIERQGVVINQLIRGVMGSGEIRVLDCACGIGTQAIALARLDGYVVHATDISAKEVERARKESARLGASMTFGQADMRTLDADVGQAFDVVLAFDNAVPHLLTDDDLQHAADAIYRTVLPGGVFIASIRDYDAVLLEKPTATSHRMIKTVDGRRVVFQVWDWEDEHYTVTQFIVVESGDDDWQMRHYTTRYRALRRETFNRALKQAGFTSVEWVMPDASGFYQPVVIAQR